MWSTYNWKLNYHLEIFFSHFELKKIIVITSHSIKTNLTLTTLPEKFQQQSKNIINKNGNTYIGIWDQSVSGAVSF